MIAKSETHGRTFYHGTGVAAAKRILTSQGKSPWLEAIGARSLGREIRDALFDVTAIPPYQYWRFMFTSECRGVECRSPWVQALLRNDAIIDVHDYNYDHFCVTLAQAIAYRYTMGNPYRSEFIHAIGDGLRVLDAFGCSLRQTVQNRYPEVHQALTDPSPPVVLEMRGFGRDRLLTGEDSDKIDPILNDYDLYGDDPTVSAPFELRAKDVAAADVIAVHDLRDWPSGEDRAPPWKPEPARVALSRKLSRDWLRSTTAN